MKALIYWFAIVLFFIIQVAIRWRAELVSDAAWFIYIASGLLDGKILYKDFIEVNPPLGIWLMVQIVWISRLISANAIQVLGITMVFLSAISLAFVNHYLRFNKNVDDKFRMTLVTAMAFAILFFPGEIFLSASILRFCFSCHGCSCVCCVHQAGKLRIGKQLLSAFLRAPRSA